MMRFAFVCIWYSWNSHLIIFIVFNKEVRKKEYDVTGA